MGCPGTRLQARTLLSLPTYLPFTQILEAVARRSYQKHR
jgi:hypothetical protein